MSNYAPGTQLYIAKSGIPDYINQLVTVLGPGPRPNTWSVKSGDGWEFPNGATVADIDEAYLSQSQVQR